MQVATFEEATTLLQRAHGMLIGPEHTEQRLGIEYLLANVESIRGHYAKAAEILTAAVREARTTPNLRLQANLLGQLGRVAMWQGDVPTSMKHIGEALELSRKAGDRAALIFNLRQMGNAITQTDPVRGIAYHEESVQLARQAGDRNQEAYGLNSLAISIQLSGDSRKAMATFQEALELNRARNDRLDEAMVLGNMAGIYSAAGDLVTAERIARESMTIAQEIGAISLLPMCQSLLAEINLRRGNHAEARAWIRTTGETARSIGIPQTVLALLYGILKVSEGDRSKGLAWVGFARVHDPNTKEVAGIIRSFDKLLRGDGSEEEMEAAMRAGESLKLDEILAEAEREDQLSQPTS